MRNERSRIDKIKDLCEKLSPYGQLEIKRFLELRALEQIIALTQPNADRLLVPLPFWWTIPKAAEFLERDRTLVWRDARAGKLLTKGSGRNVRISLLSVLHQYVRCSTKLYRKLRETTPHYYPERRAAWDEVIEFCESLESSYDKLVELVRSNAPLPAHLKGVKVCVEFRELCRRVDRAIRSK